MVMGRQLLAIVVAIFLVNSSLSVLAQDCAWNKDFDFPEDYPPLLIDLATWISLKAVDDNGSRMVKVSEGTSVVVACSGTSITSLDVEVAEGVCSGGGLSIGGTIYSIMDLACTKRIDDATQHLAGNCGDNDRGIIAQIGFIIPGYPFYSIIDVCFDDDLDITLYAEHKIDGQYIPASDGNPSRPSFQDDDNFYQTFDPNDCYLTANQDDYATNTLGDASYIDLNGGIYFSRGHLSPNADFLTEMEADATFYFSNAIPQWQSYNGGNWAAIESDVRDLAVSHNSILHIHTGPWDNLVVKDITDQLLSMFICDDIGIHEIPISESIWKVIHEPSSGDAVAILTSNRPYQEINPTEVCPSFDCDTLGWLFIDEHDLARGYSYCCTVQDFYDVNPNAPNYPDAGILMI